MISDTSQKRSLLRSFSAAFAGLKVLFCNERNFRFHLFIGALTIGTGAFFQVKTSEWIAVMLMIALVLFAEAVNTGIEYICDLISPEYDLRIKRIKDIAAGAVLLVAMIAVIVGCIIFIPYFIRLVF